MKKFIIVIVLSLTLTSCKSQEIEVSVNELLRSTQKINNPKLYHQFLIYGKDAVPFLIKKINVNRKSYTGYFNLRNSNLMSLVNYDGVYAAYMIEFILSDQQNLDKNNTHIPPSYVLFNRDVIIRPKDMRPLDLKICLRFKIYTKDGGKKIKQSRLKF